MLRNSYEFAPGRRARGRLDQLGIDEGVVREHLPVCVRLPKGVSLEPPRALFAYRRDPKPPATRTGTLLRSISNKASVPVSPVPVLNLNPDFRLL